MGTDERIGKHFLYAGPGYGGSCFPKDVQALMATARREKIDMQVVNATEAANVRQKHYLSDQIKAHFAGHLQGKSIGIWGLAFKPNTDDMREAPSLTLINDLIEAGANVRAFDPVSIDNARELLGDRVKYCESSYEATEGVDALVLVTEWNEFKHIDLKRVKLGMNKPVLFDGRNIFNPRKMTEMGFTYFGIGRGKYSPYRSS
jgi:UDPglucose 6-dehydrogenase